MMIRIARKYKEAFTLTEVVISVFLLALVWLAAVNVIVISRASGSMARHKIQAAYVIQQKIEDLRKQVFNNIAGSTATVSIDTKGTPDNTADDLTATQIVTVSPKPPLVGTAPIAYYTQVLVKLDWKESFFGKSKTVIEYAGTYIANDPQAN